MTWVKWIRLGNQSPVFPFFPLILDRRLAVLSHHLLQRLKPSGKYSPTVALIAGDCLEYQKVNRERSGCWPSVSCSCNLWHCFKKGQVFRVWLCVIVYARNFLNKITTWPVSWAFNFEALNVPCSYGRESQTTGRWLNNEIHQDDKLRYTIWITLNFQDIWSAHYIRLS